MTSEGEKGKEERLIIILNLFTFLPFSKPNVSHVFFRNESVSYEYEKRFAPNMYTKVRI